MTDQEFQTILSPFSEEPKTAPVVRKKKTNAFIYLSMVFVFAFAGIAFAYMRPPSDFAPDTIVDIPAGYTLTQIGKLLEEHAVVRSAVLFSILVSNEQKETMVRSGEYLFKTPQPLWVIAHRMAISDRGLETRKVTIPEGMTSREMSKILSTKLPLFDAERFVSQSKNKEGYLFPDTYFFFTTATSGVVIDTLLDNFTKKTDILLQDARAQNMNWPDVITMASILEREAATDTDRRIISGILWNRIDRGMRLQVDASLYYLTGKTSQDLTVDDLANDSPYNTYAHAGLPPGPIGNPGLDAIDAALHPKQSAYLYYLSDKNGVMHYAVTFEEHKANKVKYLR